MELIKVATNAQGNKVVSARDLHQFLENKDNINTWFTRQLKRAMLVENEDYVRVAFLQPSGQTSIDYAINIQSAKEIAMLNGGDKGKEARLYFIECERKSKEVLHTQLPATYIDALKALVASEEAKEQALLQVGNLNTVLDNLLDWVSIIKIARFNKVKENYFNWRVLKSKSEELGYSIKKAESPRFGYQNLYHLTVFKACYPELNYNIK